MELRAQVVAMLLALSLTSCAQESANHDSGSSGPTRLRLGYLPIAECAHIYVAISQGYFEDENLQIDLQPMRGGATILPALQQGDLDIGFSNVVSIILLNTRLETTSSKWLTSLGGATYERPGYRNHALISRKTEEIPPSSLGRNGLRIALNTTRNIEELMLRRYLTIIGVPQDDLILTELAFPEMVPALTRGEIDVASVVEPFISPSIHNGAARLVANQYQEVSQNTLVATYAATRNWLENHQTAATQFQRALETADRFIKDYPQETREIIGTFTRIRREDLSIIGLPAFDARIEMPAVEELANEMRKYGFIENIPDLDSLVVPE